MQWVCFYSLKYIALINRYYGNQNVLSSATQIAKKQCARFASLEYIALINSDNIGPLTVGI